MADAPTEEQPWPHPEALDMVMEYVSLLADRSEIIAQATVYNTHEHQRLLVALNLTAQQQANDTVTSLARDLDVAIRDLNDGEDVTFEEGQAQEG